MFEDLVCAMMLHIRNQAQSQVPDAITQAVIGRPINFQGWAATKPTSRRRGSLSVQRTGLASVTWCSSMSRLRRDWILKQR